MSTVQKDTESIDARSVTSVLSEIANTTSETIELQEVFDRVAAIVHRVIPFDTMGVIRIEGDRAVLHADANRSVVTDGDRREKPLDVWSPRWRPRPSGNRIDDARAELDPAFPHDAEVLRQGMRSQLWEPFRQGDSFLGGVWCCSHTPHAFHDGHQEILRPIAALLGSAVEHREIWSAERRRRERLDQVDTILGTLAESLDVREIFLRLSAEIQPLLPHHLVNLTEIDLRASTIRVVASAGDHSVRTDRFPLNEKELRDRVDFAIVRDICSEIAPTSERNRLIRASGLRSWLHVPVLLSGEVTGSLSFLHREPSRYSHDDAEIARRIADRVALTLSHRQLAEEARTAAGAREKAERLEATVETLARELESRSRGRVLGVSRSWREALQAVGRVAPSDTTVLITGESGTGKEVITNLIHQGSPRAARPLVAINCAALPEQLLESELFGHEKGAFTGAVTTKIGRIEQADGGTLFLDEIAEMSPMVQAKLLRVLEEREFQRVGGTRTLSANLRLVAATNRDLPAAIERQSFREDLYYRLNVFQIHITPLRERREDILPLAEVFLEDLGKAMGRPAAGISWEAREWLLAYPWPGNVRELRNAIERAILLCDGGLITHAHLPATTTSAVATRPAEVKAGDGMSVEQMERDLIERALVESKGNKSKAARLVGLTRAQLYARLEKYRLR